MTPISKSTNTGKWILPPELLPRWLDGCRDNEVNPLPLLRPVYYFQVFTTWTLMNALRSATHFPIFFRQDIEHHKQVECDFYDAFSRLRNTSYGFFSSFNLHNRRELDSDTSFII